MDNARQAFSDRLSDLITDSGKTLREISRATNVAVSALSDYQDSNKAKEPRLGTLVRLADYFGVTVDYLLGRTEWPSDDPTARAACEYTGLSASAVKVLHGLNDRPLAIKYVSELLPLDRLIRSRHFHEFVQNLCFVDGDIKNAQRSEAKRIEAQKALDEASPSDKKQRWKELTKAQAPLRDKAISKFQTQETLFKIFAEMEGLDNGKHKGKDN